MMVHHACIDFDADDCEEQPMTLDAWFARQRAELAGHRARAHAQLDAFFDQHEARLVLDAEYMAHDLGGAAHH